jgi:hypothetical protein
MHLQRVEMPVIDHDLLLIPKVPEALREASVLGRVIPFVGAGLSLFGGCPSWAQFADGALTYFVDQGKFSYAQLAQLKHLNPRIKLSIALGLQDEHKINIDFKALIHPTARKDHADGRRIYSLVAKLGKTFVTTNYDQWLDDELAPPSFSVASPGSIRVDPVIKARTVVYESVDLTAANLNQPDTVLHLHGSVLKPERMIVTTQDYVRHYANDRRVKAGDPENPVLTFLAGLFAKKTVLFLGYGLDELEILEYVILKSRASRTPGVQPPHFILQGYFSHERELMAGMKRYYRECGIELIPYLKDAKDWGQLVDVLEEFATLMPASNLAVLQELNEMEGLL